MTNVRETRSIIDDEIETYWLGYRAGIEAAAKWLTEQEYYNAANAMRSAIAEKVKP